MLKSRLLKVLNAQLDGCGREIIAPAADICEGGHGYQIWCDMPGLERDEISIELLADRILLQGEARLEMPSGLKVHAMEFCAVLYRLELPLPRDVDGKDISAFYEDGVLRLELPRREEQVPPRRILCG